MFFNSGTNTCYQQLKIDRYENLKIEYFRISDIRSQRCICPNAFTFWHHHAGNVHNSTDNGTRKYRTTFYLAGSDSARKHNQAACKYNYPEYDTKKYYRATGNCSGSWNTAIIDNSRQYHAAIQHGASYRNTINSSRNNRQNATNPRKYYSAN